MPLFMSVAQGYKAAFRVMTASDWYSHLDLFDDASLYQTRAYGEACWDTRQLQHLVLKRDDEVAAIAQVRVMTLPVLRKGIAYVRWGPLFRRKGKEPAVPAFHAALKALREEYTRRKGLIVRVIPNVYVDDPWETEVRLALAAAGFTSDSTVSAYRTLRVGLGSSLDDLRKGLHQRWRNKLKHAEKAGYTVSETSTEAGFASFLTAYDEMMRRKSFPTTVDVRQMADVQQRLRPDHRMRIFFCHSNSTLCNALVVAQGGDTGIYLLAATSDAGLEGNGAFLLQWHALQWLRGRGLHWYDMGGINPDANPGVYQFKCGAGGVDTRQLGQFSAPGSWLSNWVVQAGERMRNRLARSGQVAQATCHAELHQTTTPRS